MDSNEISPGAKSTPYCGNGEPNVNYRDRGNIDDLTNNVWQRIVLEI